MSAAARIESVCGSPLSDGEPPSWFKVGVEWKRFVGVSSEEEYPGGPKKLVFADHVVDRIVLREENRGDHAVGWYDVWSGDYLIASLNERAVAEVYWFPPEGRS